MSLAITSDQKDTLSPDKNPGVKGIHDRFARLGVIVSILKNAALRERFVVSMGWLHDVINGNVDTTSFSRTVCPNGEALIIIIRDSDLG